MAKQNQKTRLEKEINKKYTAKTLASFIKRVNKHTFVDLLSSECVERIAKAHNYKIVPSIWEKEGLFCYIRDIMQVLKGNYTSDNIIDAYLWYLKREEDIVGKKFFIMPTCTYKKIVNSKREEETNFLKGFREAAAKQETIYFPIASNGKGDKLLTNHFTLLVFEPLTRKWAFYNSLQTETAEDDDYFYNAKELKKKVVGYTNPEEWGMRKDLFDAEIEWVKGLPQQGGTNDCAFFVLHFMTRIIRGKQIEPEWTMEERRIFKADFIEKLMMDGQLTWLTDLVGEYNYLSTF